MIPRFTSTVLVLLLAQALVGQQEHLRQRARPAIREGLDQMRQEDFDAAGYSFEAAVSIDDTFDMAYTSSVGHTWRASSTPRPSTHWSSAATSTRPLPPVISRTCRKPNGSAASVFRTWIV